MNANLFKGWVLVVFSGLALLAGVVLVVLQWGNEAHLTLYGPHKQVNVAVLMLASAAGGIAAAALVKVLAAGIRCLRRGHAAQRAQEAGPP